MTNKLTNDEQFVCVDYDQFFKVVGPMNVHPRIHGNYDSDHGYLHLWETQDGRRTVVGKTTGGTVFTKAKYQLLRSLVAQ